MKQLPEITDEFAKQYGAENTEALREGVFNDLKTNSTQHRNVRFVISLSSIYSPQHNANYQKVSSIRKPRTWYELVRENQQRGVAKETIDEKKDEIYSAAATSAKDRVKVAFIIGKIAAEEGVKVSSEEVNQRIIMMAQSYNMAPDQLAKKLKERGGISELRADHDLQGVGPHGAAGRGRGSAPHRARSWGRPSTPRPLGITAPLSASFMGLKGKAPPWSITHGPHEGPFFLRLSSEGGMVIDGHKHQRHVTAQASMMAPPSKRLF